MFFADLLLAYSDAIETYGKKRDSIVYPELYIEVALNGYLPRKTISTW